jgi:hypothetical protein
LRTEQDVDASDEEVAAVVTAPEPVTKVKRRTNCKCSASVPMGFYDKVNKVQPNDAAIQVKLVKQWASMKEGSVCFSHLKQLGGAVGLQTKIISEKTLSARLSFMRMAADSGVLDQVKRTELHDWFRMSHRPELEADMLGPYRYRHDGKIGDLVFDEAAQSRLREAIFTRAQIEEWEETGNVRVDIFSWAKDICRQDVFENAENPDEGHRLLRVGKLTDSLYDILMKEVDMYQYHLRVMNGIANKGWLRNAFFTMVQQVIRQSPVYFAVYAALRPDRNTRLVSYPYYMKYQTAEDGTSTQFRHLDLDIERLVTNNRGGNMIQGTVSLDDEGPDDCTEILPGLQKPANLVKWHAMLKSSAVYKPGALVHAITKDHWTPEMVKTFGIDWTAVPCKFGEARVTVPHLAHGAQSAKRVRRTVLPWYVGVDLDGNCEVVESGTFDEISIAHRDMMPARNSPSGLGNKYGAIKYPFPAAVAITGLGPISDSLVGRRQ